jgi:hypothetical protein
METPACPNLDNGLSGSYPPRFKRAVNIPIGDDPAVITCALEGDTGLQLLRIWILYRDCTEAALYAMPNTWLRNPTTYFHTR